MNQTRPATDLFVAVVGTASLVLVVPTAGALLAQPAGADRVAARVDGAEILVADVDRLQAEVLTDRQVAAAALPAFRAELLEQLINRRLVQRHLQRQDIGDQAVRRQAQQLLGELAARDRTLADHARQLGLSETAFRRQFDWRVRWQAFLDEQLSDQRLAEFFAARRPHYDGTQLVLRQILFAVQPERRQEVRELALRVRGEILSGQRTFAAAAQEFSSSPSGEDGGKLGSVPRHGVMPEAFARAAFDLSAGEISQPVETPLGIHLIRCDAVRPGKKTWQEVAETLRADLARQQFAKFAAQQRADAKVEYSGDAPYFNPATGGLVVPRE